MIIYVPYGENHSFFEIDKKYLKESDDKKVPYRFHIKHGTFLHYENCKIKSEQKANPIESGVWDNAAYLYCRYPTVKEVAKLKVKGII